MTMVMDDEDDDNRDGEHVDDSGREGDGGMMAKTVKFFCARHGSKHFTSCSRSLYDNPMK
jgi:hypothetical protein